LVYVVVGFFTVEKKSSVPQWPLVLFGMGMGALGSVLDSFMGATLQESWMCRRTKKIVKPPPMKDTYVKICGMNILTNEQVNLVSASLAALVAGYAGQLLF